MTVHECKKEEDFRSLYKMSIPVWVRSILIGGLIALFVLYGGSWVYSSSTFATKNELKEVKTEIKDVKKEINSGIKEILRKLDK